LPFRDLLVRIPLIPGITDTNRNLKDVASLLREMGLGRAMLLPYNPLWLPKRKALSMDLPYQNEGFMSQDEINRCRGVMEQYGVEPVG
jgi:pyruvate formate lyase activating enzyme